MIAKFNEAFDNKGFTLSVRDVDGKIDVSSGYDSQWVAIGK